MHLTIDYNGSLTPNGKRHMGSYIATGAKGTKVLFKPGANLVSDKDWEAIQGNKMVQSRIASGELRVLADPRPKAKAADSSDIFEKGTVREVVELVGRTIEPAVLRSWLEDEQSKPKGKRRKPVLDKLQEQLEAATTDVDGNPAEPRNIEFRDPRND